MSDAQERLSREECAAYQDEHAEILREVCDGACDYPIRRCKASAAYLREDADLAARLETAESACAIMRERAERCETAEAERDALAEQVASCRKALEWLRTNRVALRADRRPGVPYPFWTETIIIDEMQCAAAFMSSLSEAAGVPVAHLTGEKEAANHE
jgi:hypothetical protein